MRLGECRYGNRREKRLIRKCRRKAIYWKLLDWFSGARESAVRTSNRHVFASAASSSPPYPYPISWGLFSWSVTSDRTFSMTSIISARAFSVAATSVSKRGVQGASSKLSFSQRSILSWELRLLSKLSDSRDMTKSWKHRLLPDSQEHAVTTVVLSSYPPGWMLSGLHRRASWPLCMMVSVNLESRPWGTFHCTLTLSMLWTSCSSSKWPDSSPAMAQLGWLCWAFIVAVET